MKPNTWNLVVIIVLVLAVASAGCNSKDTSSTAGQGSSGTSGSPGGASVSGSGACPAVDVAHSWNGKWESLFNTDRCYDLRRAFYPPTADNPKPWESYYGFASKTPITFTQTGCDVTGSALVEYTGCPITLTGTVDKDNVLSGKWKAYCGIRFYGAEEGSKDDETGVFSLWMEPGGTTFSGSIQGDNPGIVKYVSDGCPQSNSNFVGKRV